MELRSCSIIISFLILITLLDCLMTKLHLSISQPLFHLLVWCTTIWRALSSKRVLSNAMTSPIATTQVQRISMHVLALNMSLLELNAHQMLVIFQLELLGLQSLSSKIHTPPLKRTMMRLEALIGIVILDGALGLHRHQM